jgi:hypothetical protein
MELGRCVRFAHRNEGEELAGFAEAKISALGTADMGWMGPTVFLVIHR